MCECLPIPRLALAPVLVVLLAWTGHAQTEQRVDLSLTTILHRHVRALGGLDAVYRVEGFRMVGRMELDRRVYAVEAYKRRPNLLRVELRQAGLERIQMFDGEDLWLWGNDLQPAKVTGDWGDYVAKLADFNGPLVGIGVGTLSRELVGRVTGEDGSSLWHIRVEYRESGILDVFLGATDYLIRRMEYRPHEDSPRLVTVFSEWRAVEGTQLMVARRQEWPDQGMELRIDVVDLNPGVLSVLFQLPGEAGAED